MAVTFSLRAYAAHRKEKGLPGGSLQAVQRAIASGRLAQCVVTVDGAKRIADPEVADREWTDNTDLSRAPDLVKAKASAQTITELEPQLPREDDDDGDTLAHWSKEEKKNRAKDAELRYRTRAGELVEAAEMQAVMANDYSTVRTKVLGLPAKFKQRLPHLTHTDLATIDELVREALEDLSTDKQ